MFRVVDHRNSKRMEAGSAVPPGSEVALLIGVVDEAWDILTGDSKPIRFYIEDPSVEGGRVPVRKDGISMLVVP